MITVERAAAMVELLLNTPELSLAECDQVDWAVTSLKLAMALRPDALTLGELFEDGARIEESHADMDLHVLISTAEWRVKCWRKWGGGDDGDNKSPEPPSKSPGGVPRKIKELVS